MERTFVHFIAEYRHHLMFVIGIGLTMAASAAFADALVDWFKSHWLLTKVQDHDCSTSHFAARVEGRLRKKMAAMSATTASTLGALGATMIYVGWRQWF